MFKNVKVGDYVLLQLMNDSYPRAFVPVTEITSKGYIKIVDCRLFFNPITGESAQRDGFRNPLGWILLPTDENKRLFTESKEISECYSRIESIKPTYEQAKQINTLLTRLGLALDY